MHLLPLQIGSRCFFVYLNPSRKLHCECFYSLNPLKDFCKRTKSAATNDRTHSLSGLEHFDPSVHPLGSEAARRRTEEDETRLSGGQLPRG